MSGSELSLSLLSYNVTTRADSVRLLVWDGCARVYVKQNTRRTRKRYKTSPWTCGAGVTVVSEQGRRRWTTREDAESRRSRWDQPRRKADASKDGAPSKQNVAQQWRRKTKERSAVDAHWCRNALWCDIADLWCDDTDLWWTTQICGGKSNHHPAKWEDTCRLFRERQLPRKGRHDRIADADGDGSDGTVKEKRSSSSMNCRNSDGTMRALRPDGQGHIPKAVSLLRRMDAGRVWLVQRTRSRRPGKQMFNVLRAQFRPGQM